MPLLSFQRNCNLIQVTGALILPPCVDRTSLPMLRCAIPSARGNREALQQGAQSQGEKRKGL